MVLSIWSKESWSCENLKSGNLDVQVFWVRLRGWTIWARIMKLISLWTDLNRRILTLRQILKELTNQLPSFSDSSTSTTLASSLSPPTPPRQLLQLSLPASLPDEPSYTPSDRPSRPSVPTPGKYGTLYGGAPSPGPNPSRSFQPPGFVPPTPPTNMARRRPWTDSQAGTITHSKDEKKKDSMQSLVRSAKADSKLSTSSWQEEYLARKKARLGDSW